jgi:hypothetical protein
MTEEEADIAWSQGVEAMLKFRHNKEEQIGQSGRMQI